MLSPENAWLGDKDMSLDEVRSEGLRSWVRAPAGAIVRRVFHPTRKLVRFSLLKCPSIPNSKKI